MTDPSSISRRHAAPTPKLPRAWGAVALLVSSTCLLHVACGEGAGESAGAIGMPDERPDPRGPDDVRLTPRDPEDELRDSDKEPPAPSIDAAARMLDASSERGRRAAATSADGASADARADGAATTASAGDGGDRTAAGAAARCTGKPGEKQGRSVETVRAAGVTRKFVMHRPASLDPNMRAPIVIVPHGYTQTGADMYRITRYWELGDKEGFVTLYPDGASAVGPWNVGRPTCQSVFGALPLGSANDQALLEEMVRFVEADQCVDREHVFVAGFSMGGYFANDTGCKSELVRAIAPHSAGSYELASCSSRLKPVVMFHGSGDRLIPYDCGEQTRARWVKRNGCSAEVEVRMVENGTCEYHKGCKAGGQVAFCTLKGMNHGWAGGPAAQVAAYPDDYPTYESSTKLSWEFFKQYAW
jgi:polyhydroxybutyrate depolymerase